MTISTIHHLSTQASFKFLPGLIGLETHVKQEVFIYIVRSMYSIIFKSKFLKESKAQLQWRIQRFEEQSELPGSMSAMPLDELLEQLEDAQYIYPIRH